MVSFRQASFIKLVMGMKARFVRWGWQELNPCSVSQVLNGPRFRLSQLR